MKEKPDDVSFEDSESFKQEQNKFSEICMRLFNKCMEEGSKEMIEGGVISRIIDGLLVESIAPNQRDIFINSVDMLKVLLAADIEKNNGVVKKYFEEYDNQMKIANENRQNQINELKLNEKNILISKQRPDIENSNRARTSIKNEYETAKVFLYRTKILIGLSHLLKHLNYFEDKAGRT